MATLIASCTWIVPHLLHLREVPDRGDPVFSAWRLATFAHQLRSDVTRPFDGNIFHPLPLTLSYSDPTVLQGLLGALPILLGGDPLIVANVLFLSAFPLCGLAFFWAGWRLTGEPRAALVAGLIGAGLPFHGEHYSHLELQWLMFVPLGFVATLRALAEPAWRTGCAVGAAVGAQWLASMYLGLMLVSVLIPFALVVAVGRRIRPSWAIVRAGAGAVAIALPAFLLTGVPALMSREARGERAPAEVAHGSAELGDYLATHRRLATYARHSRQRNVPERELFPGTSPIVLGAAGLWPPFSTVTVGLAASAVLAVEWSRGLKGWSYPALYRTLAPYRGIRVPARYSAIVGSILALLAAIGTARLLARVRSDRARTLLAVTLAALVLIDLRLTLPLVRYWPNVPAIYQGVTPDMVLAELPVGHDVDYMYFSTAHHARLLSGSSGFTPADPELAGALQAFPSPAAIDVLRRRGATHVTYNCAFERSLPRCLDSAARLRANPTLEPLASSRWLGGEVALYRIR